MSATHPSYTFVNFVIEPWDSARALREFTERYERIDALRRA